MKYLNRDNLYGIKVYMLGQALYIDNRNRPSNGSDYRVVSNPTDSAHTPLTAIQPLFNHETFDSSWELKNSPMMAFYK